MYHGSMSRNHQASRDGSSFFNLRIHVSACREYNTVNVTIYLLTNVRAYIAKLFFTLPLKVKKDLESLVCILFYKLASISNSELKKNTSNRILLL